MKKYIYYLLFILVTLGGCTKEYVVPNRTIIIELGRGDWLNAGNRTYSAAIDMPEIDEYVNENHGMLVYLSFGNSTFEPVPQVYDGISYSYFTRPGQLVLQIQSSDGSTLLNPPGSMTVKIVLIESAY